MAVSELVTEKHLRKIAMRSIFLIQHVICKFEIEDIDGFTCPHLKALAQELEKIGQITWCWK